MRVKRKRFILCNEWIWRGKNMKYFYIFLDMLLYPYLFKSSKLIAELLYFCVTQGLLFHCLSVIISLIDLLSGETYVLLNTLVMSDFHLAYQVSVYRIMDKALLTFFFLVNLSCPAADDFWKHFKNRRNSM